MKQIIFILIFLLSSSALLAEVKVLCLGEGECVSIDRNAVHPGSLSGASYQEKLEYFNWLKDQADPYGIIPPVVDFSESDSDQLDNHTDKLFGQLSAARSKCEINPLSSEGCKGFDPILKEKCSGDALSSESCLEEDRNIALEQCVLSGHLSSKNCEGYGVAEEGCLAKPLDNSLCEDIVPEEYFAAQCLKEGHQFHKDCLGYLEPQKKKLVITVISPVVYVSSVTSLDSVISTAGGSGVGEISHSAEYSVEEKECEIGEKGEDKTLIVPDVEGTCTITVSKAEDEDFQIAHSSVEIKVEERDEIVASCGGIEFVSGQDTLISLDDFNLYEPFTVLSEDEWQQRHLNKDSGRNYNCKRAGHEEWALGNSNGISKSCSFDKDILHASVSLVSSASCHPTEPGQSCRGSDKILVTTQFKSEEVGWGSVARVFPWNYNKKTIPGNSKNPGTCEGEEWCVGSQFTHQRSWDLENANFSGHQKQNCNNYCDCINEEDAVPPQNWWGNQQCWHQKTGDGIPDWAFEKGVKHMNISIHGKDNQQDKGSCSLGVFYDGVVVNIQFRDQEPLLGQK